MNSVGTASTDTNEALLEAGWAALPASYRPPAVAPTLSQAQQYCKHLTETHYENFHVASWFLPRRLRPHFESIYAYCRISDDLGDEVGDRSTALALLDYWGEQLSDCYRGVTRHPVFVALSDTISSCDIPREPFADLLVAFRQDQTVQRYANRAALLEYCRYSANPVGRLVLYASGYRDAARQQLSDATCTALQLANFWQDVSVDWKKGRVYVPMADLERHGLDERIIEKGTETDTFRAMMREEVAWARALFDEGMPLIGMVDRDLALDLDLFSRGGLAILSAIEQRNYNVLRSRPSLSKQRKAELVLRAVAAKFLPGMAPGQKA